MGRLELCCLKKNGYTWTYLQNRKRLTENNLMVAGGKLRASMWYIYTMGYYSAIKRNEIMPFCSNMNGPQDCHTEWSKSEKAGDILYDIPYMWNLKRNDTSDLIYNRERDSQT